MTRMHFDKVSILIIEPDINSRESIKTILRNNGFRELRIIADIAPAFDILKESAPDLLICSSEFPGNVFPDFVSRIRHHEIGNNPFVPIIATAWNPLPELVMKVIESGADDLLTMPLSSSQLLERINSLIKFRKKFIVTTDYIGPERGKSKTQGGDDEVPRITAPNVLKAKVSGDKMEIAFIQGAIDEAIGKVNIHKLEAHAGEIVGLILQITPNLEMGGELGASVKALMERLLYVSEDTARRLGGTKYDHVSELCQSLIKVCNSIIAAAHAPDGKDVKLLMPLSQAIQAGFKGSQTAAAALKISDTIREK